MLSWKNKHGRGEPKSLQRADGNAHYTAAGLIDGAGDIRISAMADGLRSPYKKKPTEVNDFWRRLLEPRTTRQAAGSGGQSP
jgi:hypothetical protein